MTVHFLQTVNTILVYFYIVHVRKYLKVELELSGGKRVLVAIKINYLLHGSGGSVFIALGKIKLGTHKVHFLAQRVPF